MNSKNLFVLSRFVLNIMYADLRDKFAPLGYTEESRIPSDVIRWGLKNKL